MGYENGMIYKLCCKNTNIKEEYIGSTINFNERKRTHRHSCNNTNDKHYNIKVYQFIRDNGGFDENWDMVLIEKYPCESKLYLKKRERYWIELLECKLNCQLPSRTREEYYETNFDKIKEYRREYYIENAVELKEKAKIYNQEHKEEIKEQRKQKRLNNIDKERERDRERNKEKVVCDCGVEVCKRGLTRHRNSQKHINLMNNKK